MGDKIGWRGRHTILAILSVTWMVSLVDRIAFSVAIPYIAGDYHLSFVRSGLVMSAFFASYALSQVPGGLLADRYGARKITVIAILWWSAFTALTGAAANFVQMLVARFVVGVGEGLFPACSLKAIAIWFPREARATANSIMIATNPLGLALGPLVVVGIMSHWGWRILFYSLCFPGVVTSLLVWVLFRDSPSASKRVSREELDETEGSGVAVPRNQKSSTKTGLRNVLREAHVLKYCLVSFTFNIAFWGFTTWLPTYLVKARGFSMVQMGVFASLPFFAGTVGCLLGGWLSDRYFSRNRRAPIIVAQCMAAFLLYLTFVSGSRTMLVICQTSAGLCMQFFFTAFWALPMNTIPERIMGVAGGLINAAGQVAAFISPICIGYLVEVAHGNFEYTFMLLIASLVVSCAIVLGLPREVPVPQEGM